MNNIIPIRPVDPNPAPVFRRDTITDLFDTGLPVAGDFVSRVIMQDDTGGSVILSTPGFGRVRDTDVHTDVEHPSLTLRFDFGLHITLTGTAEIVWYPNPVGQS